jgi:hypothetical protein
MDELERLYARWRAAELGAASADDDTADATFQRVFDAVKPGIQVSASFATDTMEVIASVASRDAQRATRTRRVLVSGGIASGAAALYLGFGPALSLISSSLVVTLDFLIATVVWFASRGEAAPDPWSVLASVGRATGAFVADPKVTVVLLALQGVAIAAFIALQRLLGSDPEYFR